MESFDLTDLEWELSVPFCPTSREGCHVWMIDHSNSVISYRR